MLINAPQRDAFSVNRQQRFRRMEIQIAPFIFADTDIGGNVDGTLIYENDLLQEWNLPVILTMADRLTAVEWETLIFIETVVKTKISQKIGCLLLIS